MTINYTILPEHMREPMRRYIERGITPGAFLMAVLGNDFIGAAMNADDTNIANLPTYARFLVNEAPALCHGSPDRVVVWIAHGGTKGDVPPAVHVLRDGLADFEEGLK